MANQICFRCFRRKGNYEVCPYCGYIENTEAAQAYQLPPGTILRQRYIIGISIGLGGFGITYKAFDASLGMVVAVKEFYPAGLVNRAGGQLKVGIFSGEKEVEFKRQLARFLEEARNMALFSKEQDIVNVYDFFEENQTAYIIMEYVDAPLLKDRLKQGRFPVEEANGYMLALLDALAKVHGHNIIHKDISPDNIFLTGPNTIKLFDFGAAKLQGTESERTEAVVVKPGYTPPEQYSSKNAQGSTMDIYALGAVFYEMVTGEKPSDARDRTVRDDVKKLREFGVKTDDYLERIIFKAIALDPQLRFQTAEEFKNALVNRTKELLPEEVLAKNRRIKRMLTAGIVAVTVIAGGIVGYNLSSTRGKINVAQVKEEELSLWLPVENDAAGDEVVETLQDSVDDVCPQIKVNVETIKKKDYAARLTKALENDELPDVFCIDGMGDAFEVSGYCVELSRLLHTLDLSEYLYLENFTDEEEVYALPTAMQIGVAYLSDVKVKDAPETVDMDTLAGQGKESGYADEKGVYKKFQQKDGTVAQIVGDLSDMANVEEVTVEAMPPTDFTVAPILKEGELVGNLENWYAVKDDGDENRQNAGMLLLSLLLSEGVQSSTYMDNEDGLPLNRIVFEDYKENKMTTYLDFMNEYNVEDARFYDGESLCGIIREEGGTEK